MNIIPIICFWFLVSLSARFHQNIILFPLTSRTYDSVRVPGPMTPAEYGEFGHVSAVMSGDRHLCVGSLITPSSLVTTATCCSR